MKFTLYAQWQPVLSPPSLYYYPNDSTFDETSLTMKNRSY